MLIPQRLDMLRERVRQERTREALRAARQAAAAESRQAAGREVQDERREARRKRAAARRAAHLRQDARQAIVRAERALAGRSMLDALGCLSHRANAHARTLLDAVHASGARNLSAAELAALRRLFDTGHAADRRAAFAWIRATLVPRLRGEDRPAPTSTHPSTGAMVVGHDVPTPQENAA
jgi:hypothetical protein